MIELLILLVIAYPLAFMAGRNSYKRETFKHLRKGHIPHLRVGGWADDEIILTDPTPGQFNKRVK